MAAPLGFRIDKQMVHAVCRHLKIEPWRYERVAGLYNAALGETEYMFFFKPVPSSVKLQNAVHALRDLTEDEFRGAVIKAAVPELYDKILALYKSMEEDNQGVRVRFLTSELIHITERI